MASERGDGRLATGDSRGPHKRAWLVAASEALFQERQARRYSGRTWPKYLERAHLAVKRALAEIDKQTREDR